jgi:pimeloyl-ACP methyl ester carboxylesterase
MRRAPQALTTTLTIALLLLLTGCGQPPPTGAPIRLAAPSCTKHSVPVTIAPDNPVPYRIVGWLCTPNPGQPHAGTVQLLVAGLTYSHSYWDTAYQPETYSYVRAANAHGYATFSIDRLGTGESDRPPADQLTLQAHAYAISQIIIHLRRGGLGGTYYTSVVGVGHSLGAGILQYEAGTVQDPLYVPNYLILTGYLTKANPDTVARIGAALHPANDDPVLILTDPPAGYLTTLPGTRQQIFLDPAHVDPVLVGGDENRKTTTSLAERTTVSAARDPKITRGIDVPVLLIVGQHDLLACSDTAGLSCADSNAIMARENGNFSERACLAAYVVPDTGHAINLHHNAHDAYDHADDWVDAYTLEPASRRDSNGCL